MHLTTWRSLSLSSFTGVVNIRVDSKSILFSCRDESLISPPPFYQCCSLIPSQPRVKTIKQTVSIWTKPLLLFLYQYEVFLIRGEKKKLCYIKYLCLGNSTGNIIQKTNWFRSKHYLEEDSSRIKNKGLTSLAFKLRMYNVSSTSRLNALVSTVIPLSYLVSRISERQLYPDTTSWT